MVMMIYKLLWILKRSYDFHEDDEDTWSYILNQKKTDLCLLVGQFYLEHLKAHSFQARRNMNERACEDISSLQHQILS